MRRRFAWENKGGLVGANGEEDIGDGEELVGAGEERVCLHRPLCEALVADEVARREELLSDLQPASPRRPWTRLTEPVRLAPLAAPRA